MPARRAARRRLDARKLACVTRERRGDMSLRDAAGETGLSYVTIRRIEHAIGGAAFDSVVAIADWSGVALDALTRVC